MKRSTSRHRGLHVLTIAACTVLALEAGTASLVRAEAAASEGKAEAGTDTVFSCDPGRFEGETHYVKVRMNGDAIVSIHVLRTADGKEMLTSHPYGDARARVTDDTRELCMKPDRLDRFVALVERRRGLLASLERSRSSLLRLPARGTEAPGAEALAAGPPSDPAAAYNTGLQIGWNDSAGPTQGECFNFTIETPVHKQTSLSFSSEDTANSVAEQTKVSATIGGAFGAFSASDSFSYSDQWKASANSGNAYFNYSSTWQLNTVLDLSNPLNQSGQNAEQQGNLATLCGLRYIESVPAGMLVTLAVSFGSSSESTSRQIADKLTASFELDSLSAAAEVARTSSDSSSYFDLTIVITGGGPSVTGPFTPVATGSEMTECEQADPSACDSFVNQVGAAATAAGQMFDQEAKNPAPGSDIGFFALFPEGVAGASADDLVTESAQSGTDVLEPYVEQLEQYLTLVNEIATLNNRATQLWGLLGGKPGPSAQNPEQLDLYGYLESMTDQTEGAISYATSLAILLHDLGDCLQAPSTDVEEVCSPIIHGGGTLDSAYEWYDAEHGYPACTDGDAAARKTCWFLQQNTIALQYAATFEVATAGEWSEDVVYVDELPHFDGPYNIPDIAGDAALVAFADRPYPYSGKTRDTTNVSILALTKDTDLAEIYTSVQPDQTSAFEWFGIWLDNIWYEQSGNHYGRRTHWTTATCSPTFESPCPIGFEWTYPKSRQVAELQSTNPILDMFAAN